MKYLHDGKLHLCKVGNDAQVTAYAAACLWVAAQLQKVNDLVIGSPAYLVDFQCFAIPKRWACK